MMNDDIRSPYDANVSSDRGVNSPSITTPLTSAASSSANTAMCLKRNFAVSASNNSLAMFLCRPSIAATFCNASSFFPFEASAAVFKSWFVTPAQAETTTTGRRGISFRTISVIFLIAAASSTEVPPNFMMIIGYRCYQKNKKARRRALATRTIVPAGSLCLYMKQKKQKKVKFQRSNAMALSVNYLSPGRKGAKRIFATQRLCANCASSSPRMIFPVFGFYKLPVDMGINLSCRNVHVAEHFLHGAKVGSSFKEMRRKRMAECMRVDFLRNTRKASVFFYNVPDRCARHRSAATVEKDCVVCGMSAGEYPSD